MHSLQRDPGKIRRSFLMLRTRFQDLIMTAEVLVHAVDQCIRSQSRDARQLADFCERFVGDVVLTAASVEEAVREIEAAGLAPLLDDSTPGD